MPGTLLLSCDQLMQTLFPGGCGEMHDALAARARAYLFDLARQAVRSGVTPVLDFGFWTREMRREATVALNGCELIWRCIDVPEEEWIRRIGARNAAILQGRGDPSDYYVDAGLLEKVNRLYEPPTADELPGLTFVRL